MNVRLLLGALISILVNSGWIQQRETDTLLNLEERKNKRRENKNSRRKKLYTCVDFHHS